MNIIKIKPVSVKLDTLIIAGISINLDQSAVINVVLEGVNINQNFSLFMDAETYAGWGDDDQYVINWVMKELGLSYPTTK